jgi:hypothetical protein
VKDWERREAEMHKEFCRSRLVDEAEQDDDKLTADERVLVERVCNTTDRLSPPVGQLVNIIDRLAPKPAPKETVEDVLADMCSFQNDHDADNRAREAVRLFRGRLEAALKGGAK